MLQSVVRPTGSRAGVGYQALAILLVTAAAYVAIVSLSVRHYGGNLSALIAVGQRSTEREAGGLGHGVVVFRDSTGYDGQTYYYVADDPFLQKLAFRDPFRYQRIGYPLAVWAVSLGQRAWRPAAMVAINLAAVLAVALLSWLLLASFKSRASPWWALACALTPSLIIGVQLDLAEPLMTALCLGGLLLYLRGRIGWAALALACALLTREAAILFLLPLIIAALARRRFTHVCILALAVVPYAIWQLVLLGVFGRSGASASGGNFGLPLGGILAVLNDLRHTPLREAIVHQGSILLLVAYVCAALVVATLYLRRHPDVIMGGVAAHALTALFAAPVVWIAYTSAGRVFGGLFPLAILAFAWRRDRGTAILAYGALLLTAITIVRLVIVSPAQPYYLTP